ncbi:MAG: sugar transferase [Ignavibacteriae bacterium]|nr:sugar transferase [Ignavibacteriota bacterium]
MFKNTFIENKIKPKFNPCEIIDKELVYYFSKFINPFDSETKILDTSTLFNIESLVPPVKNIVNLRKINTISSINKLFETINKKLPDDGVFIGCVETYNERRTRIFHAAPKLFSGIAYFYDFIVHRVFPKIKFTRSLYKYIFFDSNKALSFTEAFGRLFSCGFEVINSSVINNVLYFICRKVREPFYDEEPTTGILYKMKRLGKGGKTIVVYKIRTMNPFAEYLQGFVFKMNKLKEGGKFQNDFRITSWGRFLRKYWLDELPMLVNLLKGDLKLVGVRPLSKHYFDLYSQELKELRLKFKPGLLPPFYADIPKTFEEIMKSEKEYLEAYRKNPIKTDFKYFFKILRNIILNKARSS